MDHVEHRKSQRRVGATEATNVLLVGSVELAQSGYGTMHIVYVYIYIVTYLYDTEETRGLKRTVPADDPISISSESPEPPASRASAVVRPGRRQSLDSPGEEESVSLQQTAEVRAKQNPKNQRSAVA